MTDLLAVLGPTASGKTKLAVALAKRYGGEVISCDSMQVYKGMDIGTAKPALEETEGVAHHLLSVVAPSRPFSVADYAALARRAVGDVALKGRLPILVGGTGLYADAVIDDLRFDASAPKDEAFRRALREKAARDGGEALLEALRAVDPETAGKLHPHNLGRIVRALEVYRETGRPFSAVAAENRARPSPYRLCLLGLFCSDRAALYRRIERRVDEMFARGLENEVRALLDAGLPADSTAMQAIGYKETAAFLRGEISRGQAVADVKLHTRRYAKRQMTWFRRDPRIHWLDVLDASQETIFAAACAAIEKYGFVCYNTDRSGRSGQPRG